MLEKYTLPCPHCGQMQTLFPDAADFSGLDEFEVDAKLCDMVEDRCRCMEAIEASRVRHAKKCVTMSFRDDVKPPFGPVGNEMLDFLIGMAIMVAKGKMISAVVKVGDAEQAKFKTNKHFRVEVTRERKITEQTAF